MLDATQDMEHVKHVAFCANLDLPNLDALLTSNTRHGLTCKDLPILFEPTDAFQQHLQESPEFKREENFKDLTPQDIHGTLPSPANVIPGEDHITAIDDQAELLQWHYCSGHQSFKLIKLPAALKILP